jgi:DHHC palmitoyltransferase
MIELPYREKCSNDSTLVSKIPNDGRVDNKLTSTLDNTFNDHRNATSFPGFAIIRYIFLSSIAIVVTITCPGRAFVQTRDTDTIILILVSVLVLMSIFVLHGSDPGYLSSTVMERWVDENDEEQLLNQSCDNDQDAFDNPSFIQSHASHDSLFCADADPENNISSISSLNYELNEVDTTVNQLSNLSALLKSDISVPSPNMENRRKYCATCQIAPPIRSHHCKYCNQCVAMFDHHCHFIGTCIGERNYFRFYCFLILQSVGFLFCCRIVHSSDIGLLNEMTKSLHKRPDNSTPVENDTIPWYLIAHVVIAKVYLYPLTFVSVLMVIIHTALAVTNSTTFECSVGSNRIDYLQDTDVMDLPFSQGATENIYQFCCIRSKIMALVNQNNEWTPTNWRRPGINVSKYSEDWYNNPWRNKYWNCC